MKANILLVLFTLIYASGFSQGQGAVEHYYYVTRQEVPSMVPIVHYTSPGNWYGEARYNYEDFNTMSVYGGRKFSGEGALAWSATPLLGGMVGLMNGGSVGLNFDVEHGNLFLASQSQYSFSLEESSDKYFFTWSEIGYQPLPWCYAGFAVQQTSIYHELPVWETGYMLGFTKGKWTVPLYVFSVATAERFFILGVNWEWEHQQKKTKKVTL